MRLLGLTWDIRGWVKLFARPNASHLAERLLSLAQERSTQPTKQWIATGREIKVE